MSAPLPTLTISLVTFEPDIEVLADVIISLRAALRRASAQRVMAAPRLIVVDNGPRDDCQTKIETLLERHSAKSDIAFCMLSGHGNVGYGRGHNKAISQSTADYHLILNPDVLVAEDAIANALKFMGDNPDVGLLAPAVLVDDGTVQHLCKDYPTVLDLALRGFAPEPVRTYARKRLARYEMKHMSPTCVQRGVPLVSGSFMFFRRRVLELTHGFSDAYFLYFEDFDLSLRAARFAIVCYVPTVRIEHKGGYAGKKGPKHWWMFGRSAYTFFSHHGWRWY